MTKLSLTEVDTLARVHAASNASPPHITLTSPGFRIHLFKITDLHSHPTRDVEVLSSNSGTPSSPASAGHTPSDGRILEGPGMRSKDDV